MAGHEHEHDHKETDINLVREVGAFSYRALQKAKEMVKPGAKLLDVAAAVDRFVADNGFGCAFPLNLSVNNEAAHYTPCLNDDKVFGEEDVVKVDFGASKDGVLGDCAVTVDLSGKNGKLVEAAESALANAISKVRAGVRVCDIGREIERTASSFGFAPVRNLGGHGVEVHDLHAEVFIPNYDNRDETELEEGQVVAIEPFIVSGTKDQVVEGDTCEIYQFMGEAPIRSTPGRKILAEIGEKYNSEPFAARWLGNVVQSKFELYAAIGELVRAGSLERYPILVLPAGNMVAQAEKEVLVQKDSCEILTM